MFKNLKFRKLEFISDFGFRISSLALLFLVPLSAFAAGLTNILDASIKLVEDTLIPLAFAACLFYFFFGIYKYIWSGASSEKAAEEGKRVMLAGIIGIFVAFSIWGIIKFLQKEIDLPQVDKVKVL